MEEQGRSSSFMRTIIPSGFSLLPAESYLKMATVFLLLLFLPALLAGCLAYSLEQGSHGAVPVVQPENEEPPAPGEEEGGEPDLREKELEESLAREEEALLAREERRKLEEKRREELGPFYVPLPFPEQKENPPVKARGIYLTGHTVGHPRYRELLDLVELTELNAVVIDVKNDHGMVTYATEIEIVQQVGANRNVPIKDLKAVLEELHSKNIYTIARVVVFKDPYLAEQKPEWSIQRKGGGLWRDLKGVAWINPYERNVWEYNIAISREAALQGFREIQFDYIRFPENAHIVDREAYFPGQDISREEVIREFLAYAAEQLKEYNVYLSADVFGVIATSWGDSDRIGQTWEEMSPYLDYICPMVYPSHYGPGYFGFSVPDAHPGKTVEYALSDALKRNATLPKPAIIRPWLQSFTASWVPGYISYGPAEIRQQIEAAQKMGIDEYLLWNANNRYQPASLLPAEEADRIVDKFTRARAEAGQDALGRTPRQAVELFLEAIRRRDWREAYALQVTDFTLDHRSYPEWKGNWTARPTYYAIEPLDEPVAGGGGADSLFVNLEVHLTTRGNEFKLVRENWELRLENQLWRVRPSDAFVELMTFDPGAGEELPRLTHKP
ncbi:MAG: hypothetical protein C4554_11355 [Dethiobacter sp.]|jgi:hypothetical protein|nr:MAG: hypothetical protein C4554_11355 [Dethiobacter sp.]